MINDTVKCVVCNSNVEKLETVVRERIGCAANCSGKMVQRIIAYKCKNCGNIVRAWTNC